jgi:hypothetical protein
MSDQDQPTPTAEETAAADEQTYREILADDPISLQKLAEVQSKQERVEMLSNRIDLLDQASDSMQREVNEKVRAQLAPRFADINLRAALLGGNYDPYGITVMGTTYFIWNPTGEEMAAITDHFVPLPPAQDRTSGIVPTNENSGAQIDHPKSKSKIAVPPSQDEAFLMAWLRGVRQPEKDTLDLTTRSWDVRLTAVRKLPRLLFGKLIETCRELDH